MQAATRADYIRTYFTLFAYFQQERGLIVHNGHPFEYADQVLIEFFTMMSIRRITAFKARQNWPLRKMSGMPAAALTGLDYQHQGPRTLCRRFHLLTL